MDIFLNEKSLLDIADINIFLFFLRENIRPLYDARIKIFTRIAEIDQWCVDWDAYFDATTRIYITPILLLLEECPNNPEQFYYYHIRHQHFDLSISENISTSSIAIASNKILSEHITAVLNISGTYYCERPHLPVLKSSYDPKLADELANIPCFQNAKNIIQFVFLNEKIKPLFNDENEFKEFTAEYIKILNNFDFSNWEPKHFIEGRKELISTSAFPACKSQVIKEKLSLWKVKKGAFLEKIANYRQLGGLILELHGYARNSLLSSHYGYDIYEAGYGNKKLLISIDIENGGFEVLDSSGDHIGVYGYDGEYKKHYIKHNDIDSHSLRGIPQHMFIYN